MVFNGALLLIVLVPAAESWPDSGSRLLDRSLALFFLGVIANALYCVAYVADLFVQFAGLAGSWRWFRPVLLAIGTGFAATIAHWVTG